MKICLPAGGERKDAELSSHFGSTPCFVLYDVETGSCETVRNTKSSPADGQCRPMDLLAGRGITAVICRGMGRGAAAALEAAGIKIFVTRVSTVGETLNAFQAGALLLFNPAAACTGRHGHGAHAP